MTTSNAIASQKGLTVADLIASLSILPADMPVLIEANGASEHLMLVTWVDPQEVDDQLAIAPDEDGDDVVVLPAGEYVVLSAVELPYLIDDTERFCTPSCAAHGSCWRREAGLAPEPGCTYDDEPDFDDDPEDWR